MRPIEMTWEEYSAVPDEQRGLRHDPTISGGVRQVILRDGQWLPVRMVEAREEEQGK